jgi:3-oxoacyl-[acyl-carrier protein] reductase
VTRAVAVVTGAASGMGRACAERLAGDGNVIAAVDRDADGLRELVASLRDAGTEAIGLVVDVGDPAAVGKAFAELDAELGTPTSLVSAAGVLDGGTVIDGDPARFHHVLDVNFGGTVNVNRAAAKLMVEGQVAGRIVNFSSLGGLGGRAGYSAYCASKAAVESFTKSLALEVATHRITVNVVAPGAISTPMVAHYDAESVSQEAERIPLGRWGSPAEVAAMVSFLVSADAAWVTGTKFAIDGGVSAAIPGGRSAAESVRRLMLSEGVDPSIGSEAEEQDSSG